MLRQNAISVTKSLFQRRVSPVMAPLALNINCLKQDWSEPDQQDKSIPEGFDSCQWKAFKIIDEFLQPKSSLLLESAVNRIIKAFPESAWILTTLNELFIELAQQIPYNHQSHCKLATLVCVFGRGIGVRPSERIDEKKDFKSLVNSYRSDMGEDLFDYKIDPRNEEGEPLRHVNYQAFLANLDANGLWYSAPVNLYLEFVFGLEKDHGKVTQAQKEAFIMGPAQWILWNGQGLVRSMIWRPHITKQDKEVPLVKLSEKELEKEFEMTQGKWRTWSAKFRQVAADNTYGEDCRDVAARAADMMDALGRNMWL